MSRIIGWILIALAALMLFGYLNADVSGPAALFAVLLTIVLPAAGGLALVTGRWGWHGGRIGARREALLLHSVDRDFHDARGSAAPAGVQNGGRPCGMRDENGDTIRHGDRHPDLADKGDVAVGRVAAEPSVPGRLVDDDAISVNLRRGRQPLHAVVDGERGANRVPP
mgnify:CR=1 FL=1